SEGTQGSYNIAQVAVSGGQTAVIPTKLVSPRIWGLAPDGSSLLALDGNNQRPSLWTVPLPTGDPRRLGSIEASSANFFPDGRVVFTEGTGLYSAEKDGSNVRKLPNAIPAGADYVHCPSVSQDGRLVFVTHFSGDPSGSFSLVESGTDGSTHTID